MSEPTPTSRPRTKKTEVIEDAVVVEDAATGEPEVVIVEATEEPVPAEAIAPEAAPAPAPAAESQPTFTGPQVVYVHTPPPPTRKGNRGVGAAIAVASGLIFLLALSLVTAIMNAVGGRGFSFAFLAQGTFYLPTLFFVIGFVLLVLLANRANWWAYIFGSILVGLFVYFGTIGSVMLANGAILGTPENAAAMFEAGLVNPIVVAAALIAREVSLWTGSLIARRGRRVSARNIEARDAWEREVAETRAQYEAR